VRFIAHGIPALLIAFLLAYAIWFRRVVLDIPVALRLVMSVIPGCVLYRVLPSLYSLVVYRSWYAGRIAHSARGFSMVFGLPAIVAGIAGLVLYHVWRDVKLEDFRRDPIT